MICAIVQAGAIDWCGTHNKPLTKELEDGTPVCRMYKPDKPLKYIPPQFHITNRED